MVNPSVQWMRESSVNTAYISFGSNLGDKKANIIKCIDLLSQNLDVLKVSPLYDTPPWGFDSDQSFINGVIEIKTDLLPLDLLRLLLKTEKALGRVRISDGKYHNRLIDLDILMYNSLILEEQGLIVPHPRLHLRNFVLWPLTDIAPNLVHPLLSQTIEELKDQSQDRSEPILLGRI